MIMTYIKSNGESDFWERMSNLGRCETAGKSSSNRIPDEPPPLACLSVWLERMMQDGEKLQCCKQQTCSTIEVKAPWLLRHLEFVLLGLLGILHELKNAFETLNWFIVSGGNSMVFCDFSWVLKQM